MTMILSSPSTVVLPDSSEKVKKFLTYADRSAQFMANRHRQNYSWKRRDPDGHAARMEELKALQKKCILMQDEQGRPYTYSGLWQDLRSEFGWDINGELSLPQPKNSIPWSNIPDHEARYYQDLAVEALFANAKFGPCAIELPTGSGKSRIIEEICKRNPVQTTIITPSKNITNQLYKEMVHLFGIRYVGKYGDGRHDLGKLFTVCTGQALVRLVKGTPAYEFFSNTIQFVWDESHTTPADTFESVCLGSLGNAPYRFFVSATQTRTDGSAMLLRGITGPVVYSKSFRELVNEGFLARPHFMMFNVSAYGASGASDTNLETRNQLYLNPNVNRLAAEFSQKCVTLAKRPTIILIDEFSQFMALRKFITLPFEFAHGGARGKSDLDLPSEYHKPDVDAMKDRFNRGENSLLIGTSAISTGMDFRTTGALTYLQGGTSEIQVKQGMGRATRVTEDKDDFYMADFRVVGSPAMERHADARLGIYREMGDDIQEITR